MTEEKKRPKIVLVDGNNYLFRAFYAIRELSNSKGVPDQCDLRLHEHAR